MQNQGCDTKSWNPDMRNPDSLSSHHDFLISRQESLISQLPERLRGMASTRPLGRADFFRTGIWFPG